MSNNATDAITLWFTAAEELGEFIGIRFGRIPASGADPEWTFLHHTEYDGVGGLAELLRRRGVKLDRLLQIKYPSPASWLPLVKSLPRYFKRRHRLQWMPLPQGPAMENPAAQPPPAVAWHVFDDATTTHLRRVCRKLGITVNSFLLKHLTKAIRPSLQDESSVVPWMIPVNLRGKIIRQSDTANHSSYISVSVKSFETVQDVHRNIYAALGTGEHWANWHAYQLGRFTSAGLRKFLITKELASPQWYLGGFSNLGDWDPEKRITDPACRGPWFFCPPVLSFQVIGAGCVTFQNQLSLTIQTHPCLTTNPEVPKDWLANWVKEIELDVVSLLEERVTVPWLGG